MIELPDLNRYQSALTVSDWQQLQRAFAAIRELQGVGGEESPFVTPQMFGAVGDGVADDAAAIQAAIDSVSANGGGVVVIPAGAYKIGTTLVLKSGARLRGEGREATSLVSDGTLSKLLIDEQIDGYNWRPGFSGITFVDDGSADVGVEMTQTRLGIFEDFRIEGCSKVGAYGMKLHGSNVGGTYRHAIRNEIRDFEVTNCYNSVYLVRASGYGLHEGPNFNQFDYGECTNFVGTGVHVEHGEGNRFWGVRNETSSDDTTAWKIDDAVTTLIDCAADGVMFTVFVRIVAGSTGSINQITVGGTGTLAAPVAFNTDLRTTAGDVVTAINSHTGTSGYTAELSAVGADIHVFDASGNELSQSTGVSVGFSGSGWSFLDSSDVGGGVTGANNAWGIPEGHGGSNAVGFWIGDTASAVIINPQGNGPKDRITFESATAHASTVILRNQFNLLGGGAKLTGGSGATGSRPTGMIASEVGRMFFDTTLGKPIWWTGSAWVDGTGAAA